MPAPGSGCVFWSVPDQVREFDLISTYGVNLMFVLAVKNFLLVHVLVFSHETKNILVIVPAAFLEEDFSQASHIANTRPDPSWGTH